MTDPTQRIQHLEALHAEHLRSGRQRPATWLRGLARDYCQEHGITPPGWCALKRGGPAPAPTLAASVAEHTGPVACPRYLTLRDWARAQSGSRVICWHGDGRVSVVWIATDADRRRSQTFESEAQALDAITANSVRWAAPKKAKPKLTAGGHKRRNNWATVG